LLREAYSPRVRDYYMAYVNTNMVAVKALRICGFDSLANDIQKNLMKNFGRYLKSNRWEVLTGVSIDDVPRNGIMVIIAKKNSITVAAELRNGTVMRDWEEYADWLLIESINSAIKGNRARAQILFNRAMEMWDGQGFRDKSFRSTKLYDTYKLALAIYAYRLLGKPAKYSNETDTMMRILARAQDPTSGGVFTNYETINGNTIFSENISDRNTETTSIVILALYSQLTSSHQ